MSTTLLSAHDPRAFSARAADLRLGVALVLSAVATMAMLQSPAARPAAAVGALDARYGGALVAAFEGRDGECGRLTAAPLLVIEGQRASFRAGPAVLQGVVHAHGRTVLSGTLGGPATLTGRLDADGRFVGELRGWNCAYSLELTQIL
ncbi:hypothetical protein [Sabulicella rubraurantiaca]|uniref:hypothetical protein n=1 Tax=Sabulicella rubraurantiaca TaxID=2811429 RepID=UPI001A95E02F|nr:hypothetical protein [Sabulicella rubraurantiaca]